MSPARGVLVLSVVGALLVGAYAWGNVAGHGLRVSNPQVVYRTPQPPDPAAQDTQAGLIAADEAFMRQQDTIQHQRGDHAWLLGYHVAADQTSVDNWVLSVDSDGPVWGVITVGFYWNGSRWISRGMGAIQSLPAGADRDLFTALPT